MRLSLSFIFLLSFCGAFAQTTAQYYDRALKTKDLNEKIKLFTLIINKHPRRVSALHRRADAYRAQGRLNLALPDYSKVISLSPKDPYKYYARALAYMDAENYLSALDDLNKAVKLKSAVDGFYLNRAKTHIELGKYRFALQDLAKIKKKTREAIITEGRADFFLYDYAKADKIFNSILSKSPDNTDALFYLGRIKFNNESYDEAISYFSKVINRDSKYGAAYRLRASAFKEIGDYSQAAQDYTSLLGLKPDFSYYNRRGLIYEDLREWNKAEQDYSKAIELNAKWGIAYNNRGYVRLRLKDNAGALADFETALKLSPFMPNLNINLAGYYWTVKKDKKNMYKYLDGALKNNFRDFDSLYDHSKKGWLFKDISNKLEFRSFIEDYRK
jgi:tetratricopeptide (TPR) repeat protein